MKDKPTENSYIVFSFLFLVLPVPSLFTVPFPFPLIYRVRGAESRP